MSSCLPSFMSVYPHQRNQNEVPYLGDFRHRIISQIGVSRARKSDGAFLRCPSTDHGYGQCFCTLRSVLPYLVCSDFSRFGRFDITEFQLNISGKGNNQKKNEWRNTVDKERQDCMIQSSSQWSVTSNTWMPPSMDHVSIVQWNPIP